MSSSTSKKSRIAFIGGGNMATAIIGGLLRDGFDPLNISVYEPYEPMALKLKDQYNVHISTSNSDAVLFSHQDAVHSDAVIFAIKPQIMKQVAKELATVIQKIKPLVISIAAGIRSIDLDEWLGGNVSVVRTMPNTPALLGEGATAMYASPTVSKTQKELADSVIKSISAVMYWVEKESLIDVVTGLSGSGPAYFFLLIESIESAAIKLGLPADIARGLAIQTCLVNHILQMTRAGKMASTSDVGPEELRKRVTSPNGTTEAAINTAESLGMRDLWFKAVQAATVRSQELGVDLGK